MTALEPANTTALSPMNIRPTTYASQRNVALAHEVLHVLNMRGKQGRADAVPFVIWGGRPVGGQPWNSATKRLKAHGLAECSGAKSRSKWAITEHGRQWLADHPYSHNNYPIGTSAEIEEMKVKQAGSKRDGRIKAKKSTKAVEKVVEVEQQQMPIEPPPPEQPLLTIAVYGNHVRLSHDDAAGILQALGGSK